LLDAGGHRRRPGLGNLAGAIDQFEIMYPRLSDGAEAWSNCDRCVPEGRVTNRAIQEPDAAKLYSIRTAPRPPVIQAWRCEIKG